MMKLTSSSPSSSSFYEDDAEAQLSSTPKKKRTDKCRILSTTVVGVAALATGFLLAVATSTVFGGHDFSLRHTQAPQEVSHEEGTASSWQNSRPSVHVNDVVFKALSDPIFDQAHQDEAPTENLEMHERLLNHECDVNVTLNIICEGCDDWIDASGLQELPWCHTELTEMTFQYTGCPCGTWYSINYDNSTFENSTGHSGLERECWKPNFNYSETDIPPEITCQDHTEDLLMGGEAQVQWIATAYGNASNVLGSGAVSVGQEYTIASSDPTTPLPAFINLAFFLYDDENPANTILLQSTTFPSEFCPGFPDLWYRHGYAHTHIVEVHDLTYGNVSTRGTVQDALYINLTIDAFDSPAPVRLTQMVVIVNILGMPINLTSDVYGVELSGGHADAHTGNESMPRTMELLAGPLTVDLYWMTRYTAFTTVIATNLDDASIQCNGFDFAEYITGLG